MLITVTDVHEPEGHYPHSDLPGGWLRAATFDMTDGLVSNFASSPA